MYVRCWRNETRISSSPGCATSEQESKSTRATPFLADVLMSALSFFLLSSDLLPAFTSFIFPTPAGFISPPHKGKTATMITTTATTTKVSLAIEHYHGSHHLLSWCKRPNSRYGFRKFHFTYKNLHQSGVEGEQVGREIDTYLYVKHLVIQCIEYNLTKAEVKAVFLLHEI